MKPLTLLLAVFLLSPATAAQLIIELGRQANGDWTVSYRADTPFQALEFQRDISAIRHPRWQADEARWERNGTRELLVLNQPSRRVDVHIPHHLQTLVRDYELIRPFSDGSAAVYTGHLAARAMRGDTGGDDADPLYRFLPRPGEAVVIAGRRHREAVTWTDPTGAGQYVYFGDLAPVAGERVLALIDPGLPGWAVDRLSGLIPTLFDHFADHYGAAPRRRPVVLLAYEPGDGGGLESGGGALPGQLQMYLRGAGWRDQNAATAYQLDYLLAHEAAHLWNHTTRRNAEADQAAWLHEGGADAMTHRALVDLGRLDGNRRQRLLERQLNTCLNGLGPGGFTAIPPSAFTLHYACGEVAYGLVEAAGVSLPAFIGELLAADQGQGYDREDFLAVLRRTSPALAQALAALVLGPADDPVAALSTAASAAGLVLAAEPEVDDPALAMRLAAEALAHLMGQACGGRFSLERRQRGLKLNAIEGCADFDEAVLVVGVDGLDLDHAGARVHDRVAAACTAGGTVSLESTDGGERSVRCRLPLPPRGPYWRLKPAQKKDRLMSGLSSHPVNR